MHLQKLEMRGFKTFADKTEIEFRPGITAIVGPNGVGKSNITDAILWAMGEQSARNLRAEGSADLIFSGTERRRPLGLAEVTITLDNSDGSLATDYSEVAIARRIYRSGESDYLLNRASVRLRDIRDLLVDTGIGPQAYSVVGQGDIDAILSVRPEDRRALIEEVAGVRKWRLRRTEAERKLEGTRANMTRIADILHELGSQRAPLEREAETARQYNALASELRGLDLLLLTGDYRRRAARRGQLLNEARNLEVDLAATRAQISALDAEYETAAVQLTRLSDELDGLREQATAAERASDARKQAEALAQERLRSLAARREQLLAAADRTRRRLEEACERLQAAGDQAAALGAELAAAQEGERKAKEQLTALLSRQQSHVQAVRERQQKRAHLAGKANALENEAKTLASVETELREREARLSAQASGIEQRQREVAAELTGARKAADAAGAAHAAARQRLSAAQERWTAAAEALRGLREELGALDSAIAASSERATVLQELQEAHEGYESGTRAALQAAAEGRLEGIIGPVGDQLEVPAALEAAVVAGLSAELQWIIVTDLRAARAGLALLADEGLGRATFLPLEGPSAQVAAPATETLPEAGGLRGRASDLIAYPEALAPAIEPLLGSLVIAESLDAALQARAMIGAACRIATLRGETVGPLGELSGGRTSGAVAAVLSRSRELLEVRETVENLERRRKRMTADQERLAAAAQERSQEAAQAQEAVTRLQATAAEARGALLRLEDRQRALTASEAELSEEAARLRDKLNKARERRARAEQEQEPMRSAIREIEQELSALRSEAISEEAVEAARNALTAARVSAAALTEQHRAVTAAEGQHRAEADRLRGELGRLDEELAALDAEQTGIREGMCGDADELTALEAAANRLRQQVGERSARLAELREAAAALDASRRRLATMREEQTERLHRLELSLAREQSQLEVIAGQLQDVHELDPEQAIAAAPAEFREQETRKRASELREAIRKLGPVNPSAIEEVERLAAREQFLADQLADLTRAEADLLGIIAEVDEAATKAFAEAFEQVQVAFAELFTRLLGGGATELALTNPEAPLDGGVEVIVQLPGKRQQNLLALSGGERALTALALLFAMIRVKPSPFCVMDEIDAALDASNTERFTAILRDFAQRSQFIIITHNPQTMVAADAHWGVTMQEPGVSMILPLELEEAQAQAEQITAAERSQERNGGQGAPAGASRILPTM